LNLAFYIAKRYLFSSKSPNAVNSITAISVLGVAIGTLSLVVVLSVFNGFESLIKTMYSNIHSDIEVSPIQGKSFVLDPEDLDQLRALAPWQHMVGCYSEKVLLRVGDREQIAKILGVQDFVDASDSLPIERSIFNGTTFRADTTSRWAIIGQPLAYILSAQPFKDVVKAYIPNAHAKPNVINQNAFIKTDFGLSGLYAIQSEFDNEYMVTRLELVQEFIQQGNQLTSLQLHIKEGADISLLQEQIKELLGTNFRVKNKFQQQEFLYKVLQTEKWAIFFILSFILLIATFNIVASVVMIVLEKRKDIKSLWVLGMRKEKLQNIFFYEGFLISGLGGTIGLIIGVILCFIQQEFGVIKLGAQGAFVVDAYPIELQFKDVLLTLATVLGIGTLVTYVPVYILKRRILNL